MRRSDTSLEANRNVVLFASCISILSARADELAGPDQGSQDKIGPDITPFHFLPDARFLPTPSDGQCRCPCRPSLLRTTRLRRALPSPPGTLTTNRWPHGQGWSRAIGFAPPLPGVAYGSVPARENGISS